MQFRIVGPLDARADDGSRMSTGGDKRGALLALLLVNANQVVSVDRFIDAIWGDDGYWN